MRHACTFLVALLLGLPAFAKTFTVNSTTDAVAANPASGICETAPGNGVCTLRAAIQVANALPGPDTIIVPAGTYALTIPGQGEDAAAAGDLDITDNLTITGAGAATTIIQACELRREHKGARSFSCATPTESGSTERRVDVEVSMKEVFEL